ncbi:MAG: hypothetical protein ABI758_05110 [Candidatus Woesebacteria bacterium]
MSALLFAFNIGDQLFLDQGGVNAVGGAQGKYATISSFLNLLVPLAFIIAGIILLFLLIGGGFAIISSGGNAKSVEQGKGQITGAVIGFLVIFAAFWIIQIIQRITGVPILNSTL